MSTPLPISFMSWWKDTTHDSEYAQSPRPAVFCTSGCTSPNICRCLGVVMQLVGCVQYRCCVSFPNVRIWVCGGAGLCPDEGKPRMSMGGQDAPQHLADDRNRLTLPHRVGASLFSRRLKDLAQKQEKTSMTRATGRRAALIRAGWCE